MTKTNAKLTHRDSLAASLSLPLAGAGSSLPTETWSASFSLARKDQRREGTRPGPRPPNIILILADDMGYGDLGFLGNPDVRTPALDALAREGICLTQHYSAAPVCAPARASLLSGKYPHRTGQTMSRQWRGISPKTRLISQMLKEAGYRTGLVGKWHLNGKPANWWSWWSTENLPWSMGFDECVMVPPSSTGRANRARPSILASA